MLLTQKYKMKTRLAQIREAEKNPRIWKVLACSFLWKRSCLAKKLSSATTGYDLN
jgi:hypothetical protein